MMSKTWYPVINYEKCLECGLCVDECTHGVYDKQKSPRPVVIFPEGCIQGCKGCGSICPNGAIDYFGDNEVHAEELSCCGDDCDCGCGCEEDCDK